jgi:cell division inhibitor SepF
VFQALAKTLDFFGFGNEGEQEYEDPEYAEQQELGTPYLVRPQAPKKTPDIQLETVTKFEEQQRIGSQIKSGFAVVVSLDMPHDQAQRFVDFLSGLSYGVNGSIHKVGHMLFLVAPPRFNISGKISENIDVATIPKK